MLPHLHLKDRSTSRLAPPSIVQLLRGLLRLGLITLICGLGSCTEAPPSPPDDLEALLGYLFEHAGDEDPEELASGIVELHAWFQDDDQLEAAREGFVISKLSAEALESLSFVEETERARSNTSLKGVHVVTKSPHCVRSIVGLLTWSEFGSLLESFDSYERTFDQDTSCMTDRSCLSVTAQSKTVSRWAGLIKITTRYQIEFRWVYTEIGWALVHRFWLKSPAPGDSFDVKMNANYYVGVTIPDAARATVPPSPAFLSSVSGVFARGDDQILEIQETLKQPGALRIHANWFDVDTGQIPLSEEMIANVLVQNQKNDSESHDQMIDANEVPGECTSESPAEMVSGPETTDNSGERDGGDQANAGAAQ